MRPELVNKSRQLARVLRHKPALWGVKLDREGWCRVSELLAAAARHGQHLTADELREIVATNDKGRFTLSSDGLRIRAAQGHSVEVDLKLRTLVPPSVLYHGTVRKNLPGILKEGLQPVSRHAVHLSATKEAALAVGARRGAPVVLVVNSYAMNGDGFEFQQADNGVWLTAAVPVKYLNPSRLSSLPAGEGSLNPLTQSVHEQLVKAAPKKKGKVIGSLLPERGAVPPSGVRNDAAEDE